MLEYSQMSDSEPKSETDAVPPSEGTSKELWEKALSKMQTILPSEIVPPGFFDLEYLPLDEEGKLQVLELADIKLQSGNLSIRRTNHGQQDQRYYSIFAIKHADQQNELIHEQVIIKTPSPDALKGKIIYDKLTFKGQVGHADNDNPDLEERVDDFLNRAGEMIKNTPPSNGTPAPRGK